MARLPFRVPFHIPQGTLYHDCPPLIQDLAQPLRESSAMSVLQKESTDRPYIIDEQHIIAEPHYLLKRK